MVFWRICHYNDVIIIVSDVCCRRLSLSLSRCMIDDDTHTHTHSICHVVCQTDSLSDGLSDGLYGELYGELSVYKASTSQPVASQHQPERSVLASNRWFHWWYVVASKHLSHLFTCSTHTHTHARRKGQWVAHFTSESALTLARCSTLFVSKCASVESWIRQLSPLPTATQCIHTSTLSTINSIVV